MSSRSFMYSFPGGRLRHVQIAATAGNVVTNLSPGSNIRWLILYGYITLVADGTAANREIAPGVLTGASVLVSIAKTGAITATQTRAAVLKIGVWDGLNDTPIANFGLPLPDMLIIEGSDVFRVTINNGVAGDSYSGYITVLEVAA